MVDFLSGPVEVSDGGQHLKFMMTTMIAAGLPLSTVMLLAALGAMILAAALGALADALHPTRIRISIAWTGALFLCALTVISFGLALGTLPAAGAALAASVAGTLSRQVGGRDLTAGAQLNRS